MKILVINSGSSSIKYQLFEMEKHLVLAHGIVEKIDAIDSSHTYYNQQTEKKQTDPIPDHRIGLEQIVDLLVDDSVGVISDKKEIDAVGHRVVHGGETFKEPTVIVDAVLEAIRDNVPLAPLHNPANITGIEVARKIFPGACQVAVFDTAFHHTMPSAAYQYAIPMELYEKYKIRRYGFHGTSHHFVALEAAKILKKDLEKTNLITIHLGNGGSITAIKNGKSIDTSMGLTPLEGLVMGTRSGDLDPAIPYFLITHVGLNVEEVNTLLNKKSGLKGVCGMNDMREIEQAIEANDPAAQKAMEMYNYRIKKYIGAYSAVIGRVDAIIFTAGIGENASEIRQAVCQNMGHLGLVLDDSKNTVRSKLARVISTNSSKVKIMVIPTNEELMIAQETARLL